MFIKTNYIIVTRTLRLYNAFKPLTFISSNPPYDGYTWVYTCSFLLFLGTNTTVISVKV